MDELLALLLNEFDLDVPSSREGLASAVQEPQHAQTHLAPVSDFLVRSSQACELAGLDGFGQWLCCVLNCVDDVTISHDLKMLTWLSGWIDPARSYLAAPATPLATAGAVAYLMNCPNEGVQALALELEESLSIAPQVSADDAANLEPEVATAQDVALPMDGVDSGLLAAMLIDAPEQIERMHGFINEITRGSATEAKLNEAQRIAHTLKGSGNIVGVLGVGRVAHHLENIMEWALHCVKIDAPVNPTAVRDMTLAVDLLHQMVSHLQGYDAVPAQSVPVLQRLMDWSWQIRAGEADSFAPEPVPMSALIADETENEIEAPAQAVTSGQSVRVDAERLTRLLRRAGQSLYASQRLNQLLLTSAEQLRISALKQRDLDARIREMQAYVDRQVVNLKEAKAAGNDFDPLEMDRFDAMYSLSRFIAEDIRDQHELAQEVSQSVLIAQDILREEQSQLTTQHRDLISARMVEAKTIVPRLRRNVQQTASATGKTVDLEIVGERVSIDADVLTRLTEPLLHLVRNAVDHGIEPPHVREKLGKPTVGRITIGMRAIGQEIEVTCMDDGRGLDAYAIHQKAIEFGLVDDGRALTRDQIYRLVLLPGFSTKNEVTEISGRGVGLDVVNDRVVSMKGRLQISSTQNVGTTFTLYVPVTTGAAQVLLVAVAGERIAIPVENVRTAIASDQYERKADILRFENSEYRCTSMATLLGFDADKLPKLNQPQPVIIVTSSEGDQALFVDAILDSREIVMQDAGPVLRRIPGVIAVALSEDGNAMFVLDTISLFHGVQRVVLKATHAASGSSRLRARAQIQRTRVLVVDDALSVRRAMRQLLEDSGYEVTACVDGQDAIEKLREMTPAIVLTDMEMPNLNGIELTQRIRSTALWDALPIVMITSRASDKHREVAREAGVNVFLTKPYTDADLLGHVRELVRNAPLTTNAAIA